jgi:hypothetical protein
MVSLDAAHASSTSIKNWRYYRVGIKSVAEISGIA